MFYLPDDEDIKSSMEVLYHPSLYLTKLCDRPLGCPFGRYCAKAHERTLLRNATTARQQYLDYGGSMVKSSLTDHNKTLGAYAQMSKKDPNASNSGLQRKWNISVGLPKCSEYLFEMSRDSKPWFLINSSRDFFSFLQEVALKEGLTQIEIRNNHWGDGEFGIAIRGHKDSRECALGKIVSYLFDPPSNFFFQKSKAFSRRVVSKLSEKSREDIYETILGKFSERAFIEFSDEDILICAINHKNAGNQIVFGVFEKLSFWVKQEGHDKFIDCCCCMDSFNLDQGIQCARGHFYCGGVDDSCISYMVKSQLEQIQHQDNTVVCSVCNESIDTQSLAPLLPEQTWNELEETRIDSKVKVRVEKLNHEFDKRLDEKIQAFMDEYGSLDSMVKLDAKRLAKQAQDDILNLKCPHCRTPYAEFTGCMAIQCGSCKGHFCGYW